MHSNFGIDLIAPPRGPDCLDLLFPNDEDPFPWMSAMIDLKKGLAAQHLTVASPTRPGSPAHQTASWLAALRVALSINGVIDSILRGINFCCARLV